jgi:polar amino acid transport system substrate-binding protein
MLGLAACSPGAPASASPPAVTSSSPSGTPTSASASAGSAVAAACSADKSPRLKAIRDRGTLRWATGIFAPYASKNASGEFEGIEADNARDLATVLGVGVAIQDYEYNLIPAAVSTDQADIAGASLFVTDERKLVVDFSTVYNKSGQIMMVLAESPYNTVEDLNKPGIKYVAGTATGAVTLGKELLPKAEHAEAPLQGQPLLYQFLANHSADATLADAFLLPVYTKKYTNPPLKAIGKTGVITGEVPTDAEVFSPFDLAFAVAKGDPGFLACVNSWVQDGLDSGRFRERYVEWVKKYAESQ